MRKGKVYILGSLVLVSWIFFTYFLYFHRPKDPNGINVKSIALSAWIYGSHRETKGQEGRRQQLEQRLKDFEGRLKEQVKQNEDLQHSLEALKESAAAKHLKGKAKAVGAEEFKDFPEYQPPPGGGAESVATGGAGADSSAPVISSGPRIAVVMFACNRLSVTRALDSLLQHRQDANTFPIIVSQDCGHLQTKQAILSYGDNVTLIEQPDLSEPNVPPKEKKFKGFF